MNEIKRRIREQIANGVPAAQVYREFSGQGIKDAKLAHLIATSPNDALCAQHRGKVYILVGIMLLAALGVAVIALGMGMQFSPMVGWIIAGVAVSFQLLFVWGFYRNAAWAYSATLILSMPGLAKQIAPVFADFSLANLFGALFSVGFLGFVFYVQMKLFPNLVVLAPRKVKGRYVFTDGAATVVVPATTPTAPAESVESVEPTAPAASPWRSVARIGGGVLAVLLLVVVLFMLRGELLPTANTEAATPPSLARPPAVVAPAASAQASVEVDVAKLHDVTEASLPGRFPAAQWQCRDGDVRHNLGTRQCFAPFAKINGLAARELFFFFESDGHLGTVKMDFLPGEEEAVKNRFDQRYGTPTVAGDGDAALLLWREDSGGMFATRRSPEPNMDHYQALWFARAPL